MNRKTLKQLVIESYSEGDLDPQKVNKIADLLSRDELRLYIRALKNWDRQTKIVLHVPRETNDNGLSLKTLQDVFPDKKISVSLDPSLLLGMKLQNNDDLFEISLKNTLDKITEHIEEQYD